MMQLDTILKSAAKNELVVNLTVAIVVPIVVNALVAEGQKTVTVPFLRSESRIVSATASVISWISAFPLVFSCKAKV